MAYYFVFFDTFDKKEHDYEFSSSAALICGDIIDFSRSSISKALLEEYETEKFIIKKRIFIHDNETDEAVEPFQVLVEPVKNNAIEFEKFNYSLEGFYKNFNAATSFIKAMRPNGFLGKSPQSQQELDKQELILRQLKGIEIYVKNCAKENFKS